ncbi:transferase [Aurantimonas sp. VKM B-3413]|uniref:transferase n=1 Tax=Aurantimonas sp. VKM B-3413 TaxID=2779401 RepID=UPI001E403511|nr:transferase [Aurantimonas sp. VKM B-3413]MCB8837001.1 transferase [Aurantimonas sp. VKM B-3413]
MGRLVVRTRADCDKLKVAATDLEDAVWGPLGFLNHTSAHREHYDRVLENFADFQLCLVDQETEAPVALANCVPIHFSGNETSLPQEGWDWLVALGSSVPQKGNINALGALAISVPVDERGRGYASRMIEELQQLAVRRGYANMIAPVRPSAKHRFPHAAMADYIAWKDAFGRCFDPWLRSHLSHGAEVVTTCEKSMVVDEHIAFWETWSGRRFSTTGSYLVEGALAPISVDIENQRGRYEEPNVWVIYKH